MFTEYLRIICNVLHITGYVVRWNMWCEARKALYWLGFLHSSHHILFCPQTVLRKPITPFKCGCLLLPCRSGASQRAKALAFIFKSLWACLEKTDTEVVSFLS